MGRRTRGEGTTRTVSVRLTEQEYARLEALKCRLASPNYGDVIRELIGEKAGDLDVIKALVERCRELEGDIFRYHFQLPDNEGLVEDSELKSALLLDRERTESELLPAVVSFFRAHLSRWGWPLPPCESPVEEVLASLRSGKTRLATAFLKSRFPSYWLAGEGPATAWQTDPSSLEKVLRYRMGLNKTGEKFHLTPSELRKGYLAQRRAVSFFDPACAYRIYSECLKGVVQPRVWDPSAGFGGRMLGFSASCPDGTYEGNEPALITFSDLERLSRELPGNFCLHNRGSETMVNSGATNSFDLVFTSPPYFDKERYFDERGQCWKEYPTLSQWREKYVRPLLEVSHRWLKPGCLAVFNVDEERRSLFLEEAERVGFFFLKEERLPLGLDHFARARGETEPRSEPIFYFQKEE